MGGIGLLRRNPAPLAVAIGNLSAVRILVDLGSDPFDEVGADALTDGKFYWCPVHLAAAYHEYQILEVLLSSRSHPLDPSELNTCYRAFGQPPLHSLLPLFWAVNYKTLCLYNRIIRHGSDLRQAARKTIDVLRQHGADLLKVEAADEASALVSISEHGFTDIMEYLLSEELGIFNKDKDRIFQSLIRGIGRSSRNRRNFQTLLCHLPLEDIQQLQTKFHSDLLLAACSDPYESFFVDALLAHGLEPNFRHFGVAVLRNHFDTARSLHLAGVDRNSRMDGVTLLGRLILTATQRRVPAIEFLLSLCDKDSDEDFFVASEGNFRISAFQYAAGIRTFGEGQVVVKYILDRLLRTFTDERVNFQEPALGWTALHFAVVLGSVDTVRYLLGLETVDVNAIENDGRTPYDLVAYRLKDPEFDGFANVPVQCRSESAAIEDTVELFHLFSDHPEAETRRHNIVLSRMNGEGVIMELGSQPKIMKLPGSGILNT